jgi:hypothetical protein
MEKIISRQEQTLLKVIDMVKFAESKNLALITFNTAIIIIAHQFVNIDLTKWFFIVPFVFWIISTLLAITSFIPIILSKKPKIYKGKNLVFYNDIGEISNEQHHDDVVINISNDESYLKMINDQISINSRIATRKFKLFKHSIRFLLVITVLLYPVEWFLSDKDSV